LKIRPNFAVIARDELKKWYDDELTEHLIEGLREGGLDVLEVVAAPAIASGAFTSRTASGESRAAEGFWVAVVPFK
jgi:hypothetical protein